jgi:hypothetical protein
MPLLVRFAAAVVASALVLTTLGSTGGTASAATGLLFPAPMGTQWEVLAGYNTATHVDIDPYALDLWRVDRQTGGTPLLAPISGTIGFVSSSCVSIRTSDVNVMMCHVFAEPGLARGQKVLLGQRIGAVAPDGQAGNNGVAHIHLQINYSDGRGYGNGSPVPFDGPYALEGQSLPAITTYNGYAGRRFVSTNDPSKAVASVNAGADLTVDAGSVVTLKATGQNVNEYHWLQSTGPQVDLALNGSTATFVAPEVAGTVLTFDIWAVGTLGTSSDSVKVTVRAPGTGSGSSPTGSLELPASGLGLAQWSGGTLDVTDLQQQDVRSVWTFIGGKPVGLVLGAPDFVNGGFLAQFPGLSIPAGTILLILVGP